MSHAWRQMFLSSVILGFCLSASVVEGAYCRADPYTTCWPTKQRLTSFKASLSNSSFVVYQSTAEFAGASLVMNNLKATPPAMIVLASTEEDVIKTVNLARTKCIRVVVRCSGADYDDRSTGLNTIQLNTMLLKELSYDNATSLVTIGAGVTWGEAYNFTASMGRVVVGAMSNDVCVAGFVLSGGHSVLSPQYGLGADNVEGIRFVLYNGTILNLTRTNNSDLFNAVLGAGASSYGIVLSLTYLTHAPPPRVVTLFANWALPNSTNDTTPSALDYVFNCSWFQNKPTTISAYLSFINGVMSGQWVFTGTDAELPEAEAYLAPLFNLSGLDPESLKNYNFSTLAEYVTAATDVFFPAELVWGRKIAANAFLPQNQSICDLAKYGLISNPTLPFWFWYVLGGSAANGTVGSVPTGMRHAMGEFAWGWTWNNPLVDFDVLPVVSDVTKVMYAVSNASYIGEHTTYTSFNNVPDWQKRFYSNFTTLMEVKKQYDPCNLYTTEFGPGWGQPTATCACK